MLHPVGGAWWVSACLISIALVAKPAPAVAQGTPVVEVAGGYTSLNGGSLSDMLGSGWFGSTAWALNNWLALAGEAGGNNTYQAIGFLDSEIRFPDPNVLLQVEANFMAVLGAALSSPCQSGNYAHSRRS